MGIKWTKEEIETLKPGDKIITPSPYSGNVIEAKIDWIKEPVTDINRTFVRVGIEMDGYSIPKTKAIIILATDYYHYNSPSEIRNNGKTYLKWSAGGYATRAEADERRVDLLKNVPSALVKQYGDRFYVYCEKPETK